MTGRHLTVLPACLVALTLLAGCQAATAAGGTAPRQPSPSATGSPVSAPAHTPKGVPLPTPTTASGDPAVMVRSEVTAGDPRLLPRYVPAGMSATVSATPIGYQVSYTDDLHTRDLLLAVNQGMNPPPLTGVAGSQTYPQFRGVRALYTVYDTTAPMSQRYLTWQEPGTWAQPHVGLPGIEYFLGGSGLTESEFFRVAASLQPVA